ncbi:PREDICTED: soluble guanylate cyclase 88E-like isoform X1 [Branchiostoma belcheri]|uniref:guanylate cyclase n=1 Tax=Branchiostoma belcheri TaxID=7741 RepID=A0A6P5AHG6_BRABE|nr:PREDICTED: soluble guanylate cyclase 88E-like isoform X1 [Branchiostoma belcheri]
MYGLLLESINDYLKGAYGEAVWKLIRERANVPHHSFVTHQVYSETVIPRLAKAASEVTGMNHDELMDVFGISFVTFVGQYGYDRILRVLGRQLRDFLNGLDNLHEYLRFSYPKLQPPSFFCEEETATGLTLHYRSRRKGFIHYVKGELRQVGKQFYQTDIEVEVLNHDETDDQTHIVFRLHFDNTAFKQNQQADLRQEEELLPVRSELFFEVFPFNVVFTQDMVIRNVGVGLEAIMSDLEGKKINDCFRVVRPLVEFTWDNVLSHTNNLFELISRDPITRGGGYGRNSGSEPLYKKIQMNLTGSLQRTQAKHQLSHAQHGHHNGEGEEPREGEEEDRKALDTSLELLAYQSITDAAQEGVDGIEGASSNCLTLKGQMMFMKEWDSVIFIGTPIMENLEAMYRIGLFINDLSMHDSSRDLVLTGTQQSAELKLALDQEQQKSSKLEESMRQLDQEMKKTDELLYQMIPKTVADRLRRGEPSVETCEVCDLLRHFDFKSAWALQQTCEVFQEVTILFSDVVGFTKICSRITPMQVVSMLNSMYTLFDQLSEKNQVYKVETIGDAYMVVSGAPTTTKYHAHHVCDMALDMIRSMEHLKDPSTNENLHIRVGVHSGMVVAGVVGLKMPRWCLFGETVNTASYMEASGEGMHVHISQVTKDYLQGQPYIIEERGSIPAKTTSQANEIRIQLGEGNELMKTYWLKGKLRNDGGESVVSPPVEEADSTKSEAGSGPVTPQLNFTPMVVNKDKAKDAEGDSPDDKSHQPETVGATGGDNTSNDGVELENAEEEEKEGHNLRRLFRAKNSSVCRIS